MFDIHAGINAEDSLVMKTGRIRLELVDDEILESFYIGYVDRICEEHDDAKYNKVQELNTVRELFYLLGYKMSDKEIFLSGMVKKNLPLLGDFKSSICNYLNRFDIVTFFERNSRANLQTLP